MDTGDWLVIQTVVFTILYFRISNKNDENINILVSEIKRLDNVCNALAATVPDNMIANKLHASQLDRLEMAVFDDEYEQILKSNTEARSSLASQLMTGLLTSDSNGKSEGS